MNVYEFEQILNIFAYEKRKKIENYFMRAVVVDLFVIYFKIIFDTGLVKF